VIFGLLLFNTFINLDNNTLCRYHLASLIGLMERLSILPDGLVGSSDFVIVELQGLMDRCPVSAELKPSKEFSTQRNLQKRLLFYFRFKI